MNVGTLVLRGFMCHADSAIEFPEAGIVVVGGINGAGKSSLIEAVSYACWGKTLRRVDPWADDGVVQVVTGTHRMSRSRKQGEKFLEWSRCGSDASTSTKFPTTTKGQEALTREIGSWEVWRRACVFSSADAAHFSLADDADRKRLLENVLGLERFDDALEACRQDLRVAERARDVAEHDLVLTRQALVNAEQRIADSDRVLCEKPAGGAACAVLEAEAVRLERLSVAADRELEVARVRLQEAERASAGSTEGARRDASLLMKLAGEVCPTCLQPIAVNYRETVRTRAAMSAASARAEAATRADTVSVLHTDVAELVGEWRALRKLANDATGRAREAGNWLRTERTLLAQREEAVGVRDRTQVRLAEQAASHASLVHECLLLHEVERVLGLRGVRAHVLGRALGGLQVAANAHMARLAPEISITLDSFREKKTGGVEDKIALGIVGAGGGQGYAACSQGERRRIDVALLLALGEVAAAAAGRLPGTLFLDEVMDALDTDGTNAVVDLLGALSETRCVVVITHREDLAHALPARKRVHVEAGRLCEGGMP